jgi:hypothetical protein
MEPRRSNSATENPKARMGEIENISSSVILPKIRNIIPNIDQRMINAMIILFVLVITFGIVASGIGIQPLKILDINSDSSSIYKPPVDSAELKKSHNIELEKAGSYTVEMSTEFPNEYEQSNTTNYLSNVRSEYEYDLTNDRVLSTVKYSDPYGEAESRTDRYVSNDTLYNKFPQYSIRNRYEKIDFSLSTWRERESDVIMAMSLIGLDHNVVGTDHYYTLKDPGEVPNQLYETPMTGQTKLVEFEAVVSNKGILQEYSYRVHVEDDGEVYEFTRSAKINNIGDTAVEEPVWIDEARAATG